MNIQNKPFSDKAPIKMFESLLESKEKFLLEHGDTPENNLIYEELALRESMDEDHRFHFENGMFIPGLGSVAQGRLTLNNLFTESENLEKFVENVQMNIASKLEFELTESDKNNLQNAYQSYQLHQNI